MKLDEKDRSIQTFAITLSLWVGIVMFFLKTGAYFLTGSAAILSDAAESVVHVVAVCFAAYSLKVSYKPADETHLYGHAKASFFSAGFEGAMIIFAALYIIYEAGYKWMTGLHLENLGLGTSLTALAAIVNGVLGYYLLWTGKKRKSILLEANGKHVLTDCWTSVGVLVGLGLTIVTDWLPWDPIFAIIVALNILWSGVNLIRRSVMGLMDTADPEVDSQIEDILTRETEKHGVIYHNVLHRNMGHTHWVDIHLLFPDHTTVRDAHRLATRIERRLEEAIEPNAIVTSHLEPVEDHEDIHLNENHD